MAARGLRRGASALRSVAPNSAAARARSKPASAPSDSPTSSRSSRAAHPVRTSSSLRSSAITRPTASPSSVQLRRHGSAKDAPTTGQPLRRVPEREAVSVVGGAERDKSTVITSPPAGGSHEPFVRGSPLRVSKRVAPHSEVTTATQTRGGAHSPSSSSSTPKSIRTAVISAARTKTTKTEAPVPKAAAAASTRIPGPKMARAASQPTWR